MPYSTIFKHKEDLDLNSYSTISYATLVLSCLINGESHGQRRLEGYSP